METIIQITKNQTITMLLSKIKKLGEIDYSGIFFLAIDRIRIKFNISLVSPINNFICSAQGVKIGKGVIFNGVPRIRRYQYSTISIGNNCKFNSAKNSIALGLQTPCTFVTLEKTSEIIFGNNSGATGLKIVARKKITIGNNVLIGANCIIVDNDFHHSNPQIREQDDEIPTKPVVIEDNVFIGFNSFILKGVTIGKNSVIGANSVVFNDIPENSIAIGNPCRVIMRKNLT